MIAFKVFIILVLAIYVFCDGTSLLQPCHIQDMECLNNSTHKFLGETRIGIPQYNIRPIDPIIIPSLDLVAHEDLGLLYHFKNIYVTGLKNQTIDDFQMNTTTKSVLLKTRADLSILGEVEIESREQSKLYAGPYLVETSVIGSVQYAYDLKYDDEGVQYFEVGPEVFTCESVGETKMTPSLEWVNALLKDDNEANHLKQRALCKILEICYADVIHNIRAAAKILPASDFLVGL